ncbi:MAG: SAM-dependent methyltransferase, partial [Stomatobaculum longum]|nr:SAM-dependent methyltransferase [Stomatobaculum longum]
SYTTGLQASVLSYLLGDLIVPRFGGKIAAEELGLPISGNGLTLPCGASGLWIAP